MWLFDTVTLSETIKPDANIAVIDWIDAQESEHIHTSAICLGELRYGMERLPPGRKKDELRQWITQILEPSLQNRIIPADANVATTWAEARVYAPRTLPILDSLIAATALNKGLTIVTRNTKDFEAFGVDIFNPWSES
jgi:toxin FitB